MKKQGATIYDVAREAGVSAATASRVINHPEQVTHKTQKKVLAAIEALAFDTEKKKEVSASQSSTGFRRKKNEQQLFILSVPHLSNVFFLDIMDGAQTAAQKNGHHLLINNTPIRSSNSDLFLSLLKSHGAAGIITTETIPSPELEKLTSLFPIVQCSEYNEEMDQISYVSINDMETAYQATKYFTENGYRHIGMLTTEAPFGFTIRRNRGYQKALSEAHIPFYPGLVACFPDMDLERSISQAEIYLRSCKPDALVCISDIYAAAAVKAAERLHICVPEQLSIIGIDDIPIASSSSPSISSMRQPRYELGYTAFEYLLEEYENPFTPKRRTFLETELILRESTLPVKNNM